MTPGARKSTAMGPEQENPSGIGTTSFIHGDLWEFSVHA